MTLADERDIKPQTINQSLGFKWKRGQKIEWFKTVEGFTLRLKCHSNWKFQLFSLGNTKKL